MAVSTADRQGRPSSRMVLLKGVDERGFVFYTNYRSRKGRDIGETRFASLLFYWPSLERQVRIEGTIGAVSDAESDAYFASRPVESRWSAVASPQSEVIDSREDLEARVVAVREQFGEQVPQGQGKAPEHRPAVEDIRLRQHHGALGRRVDADRAGLGIDLPHQTNTGLEVILSLEAHLGGRVAAAADGL